MLTSIVGINWGDEGKGRMVDLLSEDYDVVVRYQGGNNAGHTVINDKGKFILNLLPSGILRETVVNVMGNGMVIDLKHLVGEMKKLTDAGITVTPDNLKISDKAVICMPYDVLQDGLEEQRLKDKRFGSTLRGIAPIYGDKYLKKQAPVEIIRDYPDEKPEVFRAYAEKSMQVSKPLFAIGVKDTDIPSDGYGRMKKYAAYGILNDLMFGKSGEFYNKLYEEGLLSNQFDYGYESSASYAFNGVYGESRDPKEVFERFKARAEWAKSDILAEDFERSKRALYASMVKCFDSTEDIANSFLNYEIEGGDLLDYVDILSKVTQDDVTALAKAAFRPEFYTLAVVNPIV